MSREAKAIYTAPSAYVDRCICCGKRAREHEWPGGRCPDEAVKA